MINKRSIRTEKGGDNGDSGTAATNGDDDDLDTLPPRQIMLSNTIGRSKDSVRTIVAPQRVGNVVEGRRVL